MLRQWEGTAHSIETTNVWKPGQRKHRAFGPRSYRWDKVETPRTAVRIYYVGGGGGNRTHVRKPLAAGIYINSRFFLALASRRSNRPDLRATSSSKFSPRTQEPGLGPVTRI